MRGVLAVLGRELRAYFFSPLAYVVLTFFLLVQGYYFSVIVAYLSDPRSRRRAGRSSSSSARRSSPGWCCIFAGTFLTMRLISEELRSGTIETLMTAPISETQVVLGKYLAALAFYALPLGADAGLRRDRALVHAGRLGADRRRATSASSASARSSSRSASSPRRRRRTRSSPRSSPSSSCSCSSAVGLLENLVNGETAKKVFGYLNLWQHMDDFSKGIVDTRRLVYYRACTAFFLFLTSRALAAKKWR